MLGNGTQGGSGQIEALGGDAIDHLLDRIKGDAAGGNGAGNNGGDGDGEGAAAAADPYDAPATIKMLLDAAKQIAEHTAQIGRMSLKTTEALSVATIGAIHDQHDAMQASEQLHENAMQSIAVSTRLAEAAANRFETLEARIGALERKLPENGAGGP